jgi:hypothetical protein
MIWSIETPRRSVLGEEPLSAADDPCAGMGAIPLDSIKKNDHSFL